MSPVHIAARNLQLEMDFKGIGILKDRIICGKNFKDSLGCLFLPAAIGALAQQSNLSFYPCKCPYQSSSWKSIFEQARENNCI